MLGGTAAAWPLAATAQKPERIRLIGMLAGINDPEIKAFEQELEKRGWSEGRNIHIEYRYAPAGAQGRRGLDTRIHHSGSGFRSYLLRED
jgi:putative tryptophan/tyrosine transport system substrate-binding protein